MLLVNDPATCSALHPPLQHAEWHEWTPAVLVFPLFLFIVGITTHLSLASRPARGATESVIPRQIIRRGAIIFLLGFLFNGFPYFTWTDIPGVSEPSFLYRVGDRLLHWRIMGVLQRIGVAYVFAALIAQRTTLERQVLTIIGLLFVSLVAMTMPPVPDTRVVGPPPLRPPGHTMAPRWD